MQNNGYSGRIHFSYNLGFAEVFLVDWITIFLMIHEEKYLPCVVLDGNKNLKLSRLLFTCGLISAFNMLLILFSGDLPQHH